MAEFDPQPKIRRFQAALDQFVSHVTADRNVLAVVQVGSFSEETIWSRNSIYVWIIEADNVSKRLKSDGNDERIWRTLVEDDINIHAELIPRSRFKLMVEGSSRTAFSCNYSSKRTLVYCDDPSIANWFETANTVATKDQEKELLVSMTWIIEILRHVRRRLEIKKDLELAKQGVLWAAHTIAAAEVVRAGEVFEGDPIYRAIDAHPKLFKVIYTEVLAKRRTPKMLGDALDAMDAYVLENWENDLRPLLRFLKKQNRTVPLTEICEQFAYTQLYPWHLESACEWLERNGHGEKLSSPFKLTKKSRVDVEEPAYFVDLP